MKLTATLYAALFASAPAAAYAAEDLIAASRAVEIAEEATGAQALDADLDDRKGRLVYEVELADGDRLVEIEIDARTGEILKQRGSRFSNILGRSVDPAEREGLKGARPLSKSLAELEAQSGGRVVDVGFDVEAGQARYEVELSTRAGVADVYLDPASGERIQVYAD